MKKFLSFTLAIAIILSSFAFSANAFADETSDVCVTYSVSCGSYILEPTKIYVSADISDKYKDEVGYNDTIKTPSILDATLAAHELVFGSDFMTYAPLTISSSGWITDAFGAGSSAVGYKYNNADPEAYLNTAISDNGCIDFMLYQDTSYYSDVYTYFDVHEISSNIGENTVLTLMGVGYDSNYNLVSAPKSGISITQNNVKIGTTDENGQIILDTSNLGKYTIYAECSTDGTPTTPAHCTLNVTNSTLDYVRKQEIAAANALFSSTTFTVYNSSDFATYLKSGATLTGAQRKTYLNSVNEVITNNSGKLVNSEGVEDVDTYAAVLTVLKELDLDADYFDGVDLQKSMQSLDPSNVTNPYNYRLAIEIADEDYAKELINAFTKDYYVAGLGMDYYGYSCDNTAVYLTSLAKYAKEYETEVNDALSVLKTYSSNGGAFYNPQYGTDINADSTATSLMAYSALSNLETSYSYYKTLVESFQGNIGSFGYMDKSYNAYATRDALNALKYFENAIISNNYDHSSDIITTTITKSTTAKDGCITDSCIICGKTSNTVISKIKSATLSTTSYTYNGKQKKPSVTVKDAAGKTIASSNYTVKYPTSTKIGTHTVTITFKGNYSGTIKKTYKINPVKTSIVSLTAKDNAFAIKVSKKSNITGYAISYSTSKNMKGAKTVKVKGAKNVNKTIKKLKNKKRYYVRVRTYKTVNNKNYYSGYSTIKSVKTK